MTSAIKVIVGSWSVGVSKKAWYYRNVDEIPTSGEEVSRPATFIENVGTSAPVDTTADSSIEIATFRGQTQEKAALHR